MTDLTPAELNTLAWNKLPCRYAPCAQPAGRRCVTASGERTTPHAARKSDLFIWLGRQPEVDELQRALDVANATVTDLSDGLRTMTSNAAELTDQLKTARIGAALVPGLQQRVAELMARVAEPEKPPVEPEPEPAKALTFGVGMDEKAATSAFPKIFTHAQLEADAGVKLAYLHEYFRFPATGVATSAVSWCEAQFKAGRVPIPTFKLPGDDWVGTANGKYNAPIGATADALEALAVKYNSRALIGVAHEPNNDGKPLADFLAMTRTLLPVVKRPGHTEYWINLTGYAQFYEKTDWTLDACYVPGVDGYAINPYLSLGASSTKLTSQRTAYYEKLSAWAKSKGVQWGIWETGINENAAVLSTPGMKTWITDCADAAAELGATMWLYWNNRVSAEKQDWRISTTKPVDKHAQIVAAMKKYAR